MGELLIGKRKNIVEERKISVEIFHELRMVRVSIFASKTSSFHLVVLMSDKNAPLIVWNIGRIRLQMYPYLPISSVRN